MALRIENNYPLKVHNSFGMDVLADRFVEYSAEDELREALSLASGWNAPLLHIGAGCNLLFCGDYHGTVLHSAIKSFDVLERNDDSVLVRAGSGIDWDEFVQKCIGEGFFGLENLSGIPGEVGSSAVQNIGAYGVEVCERIERVEVLDVENGQSRVFLADECAYGYRDSIFKRPDHKHYIVLAVCYRLSTVFEPVLTYAPLSRMNPEGLTANDIRNEVLSLRNSKLPDPAVLGNAGSFFMNPVVAVSKARSLASEYPDMPQYPATDGFVKLSAAWMIDRCGWKGRSMGQAGVYERQPLVLVNLGGASGEEVLALAHAVIDSVYEKFGVYLRPEVNAIHS